MGITINGSSAAGNIDLGTNGTITDLAVGGLPDGTVDGDSLASTIPASKLTGALPAISGANLTGISSPLSFRNKIINGAMQVNQRGTRTAGTSNGYYACDRWRTFLWDIGTYTIQQDTDGPEGFRYSLKWDCTTADTSVAAGSRIGVRYIFEGDDLQDLKYGTSNAESMTLSFWIKSTVTGTAAVRFKNLNSGGNKMIGQNVTISAANTWEKKTVTIAGDTAAAIEGGNGAEYEIFIFFNAGTTYTSGDAPTSWETYSDADLAAGANIAINNSTSNNIWLTGVQWEKGTTATEFEYKTYADELRRAQRYYEKRMTVHQGYVNAQQHVSVNAIYAVEKRAAATVTWTKTQEGNITGNPTVNWNKVDGAYSYTTANAAGNFYLYYDYTADAEL